MIDEEVEINYWKSIQNELDEVLKNLQGIILILHDSMEFTQFIDFFQKIQSNHFTNVLYISLTRSYNYMRKALELKPLEGKLMYFIDCVSGYAFPVEDHIDDCLYHKPPQDIAQIKKIIQFGIEKCNPDIIILDSLSQFMKFSKSSDKELHDLSIFLHTLINNKHNTHQKTILLIYDTKLGLPSIHPDLTIDTLLKIEIIKNKNLKNEYPELIRI